LAVVAQHDPSEERYNEWCSFGERLVENLVEAEEQTWDYFSRDFELVGFYYFLSLNGQSNHLGILFRLKDSDVTWLYGPLHTAEEWKPPPSHRPHKSTTVTPARPNSPSGHRSRRLPQPAAYKPILKHRSISELLTSELPPTSPILSPLEFWEDSEPDATTGDADAHLDIRVKRPPLFHTKSDTQLTRWGSSRAFRKTSPLRLDPGSESGEQSSPRSSSQLLSAGGPVRASLSQDSNSSGKSAASGSEHSRGRHRKKHISFNTFVEQYIAIDKPKKNASGYFGAIPATFLGGRTAWVDHAGYVTVYL